MSAKQDSARAKKWHAYIVAALCAVVITGRMIWPDLAFDETSFVIFVILVVALLFPEVGGLLSRIKRMKKGDFEIDFENRVAELTSRTAQVESDVEAGVADDAVLTALHKAAFFHDRGHAVDQPRGALIMLAIEIEQVLDELARECDIPRRGSPARLIDELSKRGSVSPELPGLFRDFWAVRNQAVHSKAFAMDDSQLYAIVDLGVRLLRILSVRPSERRPR